MRLHRWYWLIALLLLIAGCGGPTASPASPGSAPSHPGPACTGHALTPTSNVQAAINNASPGTTFCFGHGTYHVSSLIPKSGDVFDGNGRAAVLDGGNSALSAFYGDAASQGPADVTVRGFIIQNYRTPPQRGAIQDYNGPGWTIQDNHITHNAAAGLATGDQVRVLGNLIDYNAQEGFSAHGNGGLYKGNDISYNNFNLTVDAGWEAGGGKAWGTDGLRFERNHVHDNGGPGLWADTNNIHTVFDSNTVNNNRGPGIYEEISYDAIITNNTVVRNAMPSAPGSGQGQGWGWDAGIQLRASGGQSPSSPLVISGNTVADNFNGITLIQSPSPDACTNAGNQEGLYGACRIQNVIVKDNRITMTQGTTGELQDGKNNSIFTSWGNRWVDNHYCVTSADHPNDGYMYGWLTWMNRNVSWPEWQRYGLDEGGTFKVGGPCR